MILFSKCDHTGETWKIGALPTKLSIGELIEEEHGSYEMKLYMINASTSIENQSYDLQLNLRLSDITANSKGANNITFRCDKFNTHKRRYWPTDYFFLCNQNHSIFLFGLSIMCHTELSSGFFFNYYFEEFIRSPQRCHQPFNKCIRGKWHHRPVQWDDHQCRAGPISWNCCQGYR